MNTTEYFSHDYYARNDPKMIALRKDFGAAGYGVFWFLIEKMNEQGGKIKKFPALFSSLSTEFNVKEVALSKQIEAMLEQYHLLVQDENYIWNESVLGRLNIREAKRNKKIESGRLGGIKSSESRTTKGKPKRIEAPLKHRSSTAQANEAKRKERERKEKEEIQGRLNLSDYLMDAWMRWRLYRKDQHGFNYKSHDTEKTAMNELLELSGGKDNIAAAIINQSIAKSWKGFFELKNQPQESALLKSSLTEEQNQW